VSSAIARELTPRPHGPAHRNMAQSRSPYEPQSKELTMNGIQRAAATLLGAAAAGALLWLAAQIGRGTTGGYWAVYGIVAGAGVAFALTQMRGRTGHPPAMFAVVFLPVLVIAGWVLVSLQPHGNWFRNHALAWSGDIGVRDVVRDVGTWLGVLAFGIGYTLGAVLEPMPSRREVVAPSFDRDAADEPVAAERREVVERGPVASAEPAPRSVESVPAEDRSARV
jgi:hypothetical protein